MCGCVGRRVRVCDVEREIQPVHVDPSALSIYVSSSMMSIT